MATSRFNEWATWPFTLYAIAQLKNFKLDDAIQKLYDEAMSIDFAFLPNGSPVTLDEFYEIIRNRYGSITLPFEVYKGMDLGGADQKKLEDKKKHISDFDDYIYLLTAHDLDTRISNASNISKLSQEHIRTAPSTSSTTQYRSQKPLFFALNPKYETLFTGLSVYSHVMKSRIPTLIIPIGSTDAQIIYINDDGSIKYDIQLDWKLSNNLNNFMEKASKLLPISNIPERLILAGSYMFGLDYEQINSAYGRIPYEDYDAKKNVFKKVGFTTGGIIKKRLIMRSAHAQCQSVGMPPVKSHVSGNKHRFLYNFETIVKPCEKGMDLCALLEAVSKSTEGINQAFPNIQLLGCPRVIPTGDISSDEIINIIEALVANKNYTPTRTYISGSTRKRDGF